MKSEFGTDALFSAAELAEVIGVDLETINNWVRRDIIVRAQGRLRHRLFTTEQVYKAAHTHELVKLGIPPSSACEAVREVWKQWDKKDILEGKNIFGIISTLNDKRTVQLCWQRTSGGALYKLGKSTYEIAFPKNAFAVIPITHVTAHVAEKLADLLDGKKKKRTEKNVLV
jgi:hypothetical protein